MLSYRHSYHAGNHADVLKHIGELALLEKLKQKSKPFCYFDTHSGAGMYSLVSDEAQKTAEYQDGIAKLQSYQGKQDIINQYLQLVQGDLAENRYPGSPEIARRVMRNQDKLVLMERHNVEINHLKHNVRDDNLACHHRDGFEGLIAMTPPTPRRGMVLIDPSYELIEDYSLVVKTIEKMLKRWAQGIVMVWYPILSQRAGKKYQQEQTMLENLGKLPVKNLLNAQLIAEPAGADKGMIGSGIAIINAPWQLDVQLQQVVDEVAALLAYPGAAPSSVSWLVEGD